MFVKLASFSLTGSRNTTVCRKLPASRAAWHAAAAWSTMAVGVQGSWLTAAAAVVGAAAAEPAVLLAATVGPRRRAVVAAGWQGVVLADRMHEYGQ